MSELPFLRSSFQDVGVNAYLHIDHRHAKFFCFACLQTNGTLLNRTLLHAIASWEMLIYWSAHFGTVIKLINNKKKKTLTDINQHR